MSLLQDDSPAKAARELIQTSKARTEEPWPQSGGNTRNQPCPCPETCLRKFVSPGLQGHGHLVDHSEFLLFFPTTVPAADE